MEVDAMLRQDRAPAVMAAVMVALEAGRSLRSITMGDRFGARIVHVYQIQKWMVANPEWAKKAQPLIDKNRIAANVRKGDQFKRMTHCKHGHSLHDAYVFVRSSDGYRVRQCKTCTQLKPGRPVVPEIKEKVVALIKQGASQSDFTTCGKPGFLITHRTLIRWKTEDQSLSRLMSETASIRMENIVKRIWASRKRNLIRNQTNDYYKIRSMIPESFPGRDETVTDIFMMLHAKTLRWEDIPKHIKKLKTEYDRMFPTKFRKFGNGWLVSLDQLAYEDGSTTVGDQVSRGLWD
jgi:hypothetical protein